MASLSVMASPARPEQPLFASTATARLDVRIDFDPVFDRVLYSHSAALVRRVAPDGANGVNAAWERGHGPGLYIEEQRHGEEAIIAGIVHHSPKLWRLGVREFAWGFARQGRGGNFPGTHDAFHSTSFFVEGTAHLILLLRGAAADGVSVPRPLLHEVNAFLARLHNAARWMARPGVWRAGLAGDLPYTHRRFLVASALGLTGVLTGDRQLAGRAREALRLGLRAQRRDGVFPELGGRDSSYQARGIVYAEQYLAWVPPRPDRLGQRSLTGWRGSGPGSAAGQGEHRRQHARERRHAGSRWPQHVVYPMVANALPWWGLARDRPADVRLAARVSAWGDAHPADVASKAHVGDMGRPDEIASARITVAVVPAALNGRGVT